MALLQKGCNQHGLEFIHSQCCKSLHRTTIQTPVLTYRLSQYSQSTINDTYPFLRSATALFGLSSRDFFASATASVESQFKVEKHNNVIKSSELSSL